MNPDLFRGVRGGGGNFGVVTSFEFDLHPVGPEVWAGSVYHRREDAESALRFLRDFMEDAPDEVQCSASFWQVSEDARFPADVQEEIVATINAFFAGAIDHGEEALRPITEFGEPIYTEFSRRRYAKWQQRSDDAWHSGRRHYWRSHYFHELSDEAIATLVEHIAPFPTPDTVAFFDRMGGAIARKDSDATAFPDRDKACALTVAPKWDDRSDDKACIERARSFHDIMSPYAAEGVYVNYLGNDDADLAESAYHGRFEKLVALKNKWDPRTASV